MSAPAFWLGTEDEWLELVRVLERHCLCEINSQGLILRVCQVHRSVNPQLLNKLWITRAKRDVLRAEEFKP